MNTPASKKAASFLQKDNQDLRTLLAKVKQLSEINTAFVKYLDETLKNYCQVANINGHELVLLTANSSIATQIRFQTADLIRKCKADPLLETIHTIRCKVKTTHSLPNPPNTGKMARLSSKTAQAVLETAEYIEDKAIREALLRIAKNT